MYDISNIEILHKRVFDDEREKKFLLETIYHRLLTDRCISNYLQFRGSTEMVSEEAIALSSYPFSISCHLKFFTGQPVNPYKLLLAVRSPSYKIPFWLMWYVEKLMTDLPQLQYEIGEILSDRMK